MSQSCNMLALHLSAYSLLRIKDMSRYKIIEVQKVSPPEGATTQRWYQYIIGNEYNTITSLRAGSEKETRKIASESIKRLNEKYLTHYKMKSYNRPVNETSLSIYL